MPWSFNDPIDENTDLQDVGIWNILLRACHERLEVATRSSGASPWPALPTLTPGKPDIWTPGDPDTSDPLKGCNELTTDITPWGHCRSITEMQVAIDSIYTTFWNHVRYPNGYLGMDSAADDRYILLQDLAAALGYPSDVPFSWQSIFRRQIPRRIHSLTTDKAAQAYSYTYNYILGVYGYFLSEHPADAVDGMRAQYFQYADSPSYPAPNPVPGIYKGIYVRQDGQWVQEVTNAPADILDSNNPWQSENWTNPGFFHPGDYFGYHLLLDIRNACKFLKWTFADSVLSHVGSLFQCLPLASDNAWGYDRKQADLLYGFSSAADAQASAISRLASAVPDIVHVGYGSGGGPIFSETNGAFGDYGAALDTLDFRFLVEEAFQGRSCSIDWFILATAFSEFEDNGLGVSDGVFANIGTDVMASVGNTYGNLIGRHFGNFITPTFGAAALGTFYGFQTPALGAILKWDFTDY